MILFCLFCCFFTNCCRKIKEKEIEHIINTSSSFATDKNTYEEINVDSKTSNRRKKLKGSDNEDHML